MFKRVHFERACMEMHVPILDGFQLYVELDHLKIYRRKEEATGCWEFKASGFAAVGLWGGGGRARGLRGSEVIEQNFIKFH